MEPEIGYAIGGTAAAMIVLYFVMRYIQVGGDFARQRKADEIAERYLNDAKFAEAVQLVLNPPPPPPPKPWPDPILLLTLLQRGDGRLIDFLLENIDGYDDPSLGAGVRKMHAEWQKVLKAHLDIEPIFKAEERSTVDVPAGFDPSAIRLTGNVTGSPPFKGTLVHAGWRVAKIKVSKPPEGHDAFVLQPAEVELP